MQTDGLEERRRDIARQQAIPVLAEGRRGPDRVIETQAHEPPEQQVVVQLLHQLSLAANRIQRLQQQRAQQLLGRNRRPPELHIQRAELRRDPIAGAIRDAANARNGWAAGPRSSSEM